MQCYGKYKGDRLCDVCKCINSELHNKCSQLYLDNIKACNHFRECQHYEEKRMTERCTDPIYGYDEDVTVIKKLCSLKIGSCTPNAECAKYI